MKKRMWALTGILALGLLSAAPAIPASAATPTGHVLLKGGKLAVEATTGKSGSPVVVAAFSPRNKNEDFVTDHEMGAAYPGGRFGLAFTPGKQTGKELRVTTHGATLTRQGQQATIFTAGKPYHGYVTLTWLKGGAAYTSYVLTDSHGKLILARVGKHGPTKYQLWDATL